MHHLNQSHHHPVTNHSITPQRCTTLHTNPPDTNHRHHRGHHRPLTDTTESINKGPQGLHKYRVVDSQLHQGVIGTLMDTTDSPVPTGTAGSTTGPWQCSHGSQHVPQTSEGQCGRRRNWEALRPAPPQPAEHDTRVCRGVALQSRQRRTVGQVRPRQVRGNV